MYTIDKIKRGLRVAFCTVIMTLISGLSLASESQFTHSKIDQFSALSNNKVTSIAKDKFGIYWIGTRRGLNYVINGRVEQPGGDVDFQNHEIKFIYTDSQSQLWVATDSALFLYNYATHKFEEIDSQSSYSSANAICSTKEGVVICRRDAIEFFDYASGKIRVLEITGGDNLEYNSLRAIDDDNVLLICSQGREIYRLNLSTLKLDLYEDIKLPTRTTNYRDRIFIDSRGDLWISIYNHALYRYSLEGEGRKEAKFSKAQGNLTHNLILDIIEHDGEILVATDGGGINSIDIDSDLSRPSTKMFGYKELPYSRSVYSLFVDDKDGLFMGTIRDGLVGVYHTFIRPFNLNFSSEKFSNTTTTNSAIMAFCEDDNLVWIATDGGGVCSYDARSGEFGQVASTSKFKVTDVCNLNDRELLIGVYGQGVYKLTKSSGVLKKVTIIDHEHDVAIADGDFVVSFSEPENSKVMIIADKIYQYNIASERVTEIFPNAKFATGNLFASSSDDEHQYLHNQYSVYQINKHKSKISQIYSTADGGIIAARRHGDFIWVIRNFSLYRYDTQKQEEQLMLPEISNQALSLEIDNRNRLWVTTFSNILAINLEKEQDHIYFDTSMGYVHDEYLARSTLLSKDGDIFFGGNNGFIVVDRNISLEVEPLMPIELLSVKIDKHNIVTDYRDEVQEVTVPWNYNSIDVEIYVKDRNIHHSNQFRYTIDSDGKQSVINSDNILSLQTPLQGNHTVNVTYLNNDGEWSSPTNILEIVITPPWWNSLAFKLFLTIIILLSATSLILLYNNSKERKLMQLHLEREQELSSNKIKFLINISHELRTPLTLVYAPLKRLLESSKVEGEVKSTLVKIFSQSRYMAELINMVLDARRMEAGHEEVDIAPHNFNEWVLSIVEEFRDESVEQHTELQLQLSPAVTMLNFDAPKCRIVLSNLLMNALRYSKRDGSGRIIVSSEMIGSSVRLSVIDNGVGLEGVDIDSLFNRFVRINRNTTGSGIGLSYAKAIIEQHSGGKIGAYCNNYNGATFFFELPQGLPCRSEKFEVKPYLANMLEIDDNSFEMTREDYSLSERTILVVDDQVDMIAFLEDALKPIFKRVYTAPNGAEAFKIIKDHLPSVVVSDIMMPEMDGYELCSAVKNDIEVSHTPIILLTAKNDTGSKVLGYKSGADAYISKPFDLQYLLSIIASQLRSRDIARQHYSKLTSVVKVEDVTYSNADEQFMIKLNKFIADNLSNSIDVEQIAKHMCMSRAALYKKLKTILDIGAMEYVTKIRMTTAAERIRSTSESITEIATQCGYTDNQYFSKAFKQFHGVSPSQYRKNKERD